MTNEEIEQAAAQEMDACFEPFHFLRSGVFDEERIRRNLAMRVGDEPLDYVAIRVVICEAARKLVSRAYEEGIQKAQEIRDNFHLRPLMDDHHWSGADTAAEEIQEHLRALKESLQLKEEFASR